MIEEEVPETVRGDPEISLEDRPGMIESDRSPPDKTTITAVERAVEDGPHGQARVGCANFFKGLAGFG